LVQPDADSAIPNTGLPELYPSLSIGGIISV